uniref:Aminotransferase n=1 Tax=Hirondellea gigas TaxID=1518452 RepID=A0A6A7G7S7_9CRUS
MRNVSRCCRFTTMTDLPKPAQRISSFGGSVFTEFTTLAKKLNAINLGQGFPDWNVPKFVQESAHEAIKSGPSSNQYTSHMGFPMLKETLSKFYGKLMNRAIDPQTEIIPTNGATQALFSSIQAHVNPGDEVICIEPFYDAYPADVIMAGGIPVYVPLKAPKNSTSSHEWTLDMKEFEASISSKTKAVFLNNPHNPTGKMFSREELQQISEIVLRHPNMIVISDEVYEFITFDDCEHIRIATLPGMWDRTLTISSSGKTFSCTGWKIGWAIGPTHLINPLYLVQQWIPFCTTTPFQHAISLSFEKAQENNYFAELKSSYQRKRDIICDAMKKVGIEPVVPSSGFFALGHIKNLLNTFEVPDGESTDYEFSRYLTREFGVTTIPPSAFYCDDHRHLAEHYTRFAFCKSDPLLHEACLRLENLRKSSSH